MQLKRIEHFIEQYRKYLIGSSATQHLYIWESQRLFQENWDLDAADFGAMYRQSLRNSHTRRLWKRESYEPKRMMELFIGRQEDFVRSMFRDLFDENKSLEGRASRFVFYCDELLREYKTANPRSIENNHYHDDDFGMVSLYLAFRYPDRHTLYDPAGFRKLLLKLGSRDIPVANDIERFAKLMRTLNGFITKDPEAMKQHRKRLDEGQHYLEESLLLVYDFYQFVGGTPFS